MIGANKKKSDFATPYTVSNALTKGGAAVKLSALISIVAPRMETKEYTTKKGRTTLSLRQRNAMKREPYSPQPMMVEKAKQHSATAVKMDAQPP